ncbi:MAG: Ppx/GppA phosphatase family protein [Sphingomonadales bacterium]
MAGRMSGPAVGPQQSRPQGAASRRDGAATDVPRQAEGARHDGKPRGKSAPTAYGRGRGGGGRAEAWRDRIYSALDLGTNNCRLLVAKPVSGGFRVIDAFSRIVRLGEGVAVSGQLSEQAMDRAIAALKICAEKIDRRQVSLRRAVATQACRAAVNCGQFIDRVREETGIALDVITAEEEARLAVLGCQSLLDRQVGDALVFDIGGGSTELIWVRVDPDGEIEMRAWTSINHGVVSMAERFGSGIIAESLFAEMVAYVADDLNGFEEGGTLIEAAASGGLQILGTSGTITTLASLQLGLPRYDRSKVDGCIVPSLDIRHLSRRLAGMDNGTRAAFGCIGRERADLVVAGCAILDAILERWPVPQLRVADRGIREGVLRTLMRQDGAHA